MKEGANVLIDSNEVMKKILKIESIYGPQNYLALIKDIIKSVVKEAKEKEGKKL